MTDFSQPNNNPTDSELDQASGGFSFGVVKASKVAVESERLLESGESISKGIKGTGEIAQAARPGGAKKTVAKVVGAGAIISQANDKVKFSYDKDNGFSITNKT